MTEINAIHLVERQNGSFFGLCVGLREYFQQKDSGNKCILMNNSGHISMTTNSR